MIDDDLGRHDPVKARAAGWPSIAEIWAKFPPEVLAKYDVPFRYDYYTTVVILPATLFDYQPQE